MTEPVFWRSQSLAARAARSALFPAALLYGLGQSLRRRWANPVDPQVPVICVGNASVGGTGKTPFCLLLQKLLAAEGLAATFLTRGYRGAMPGPLRVEAGHRAEDVGDEAMLLAAAAPTWVAKNRAAGAVAAAKSGAQVLIMDDGFQNPTVRKTVSFLLLSGDEAAFALFPSGPLRERADAAVKRADAVVIPAGAAFEFDSGGAPVFRTASQVRVPAGVRRVVAFCGIARPERFFAALEGEGCVLAARAIFPDHHVYAAEELRELRARALKEGAVLVTTEKDTARLTPDERDGIVSARHEAALDDPQALVRFVRERTGL
jgi:tetraacyldisaccharide 4'-kinase